MFILKRILKGNFVFGLHVFCVLLLVLKRSLRTYTINFHENQQLKKPSTTLP